MNNSGLYFFGGIIGFILWISIARAVYSIQVIVKYQKKQYQILKLMAEKIDVDENEILKIHNIHEYNARMDKIPMYFNEEIKILELLKNSNGIFWKEIYLDGINYYQILAVARDLEKRGFTTKIDGVIDITKEGIEYLSQLLSLK